MDRLSYDLWERILSAIVFDFTAGSILDARLCKSPGGARGRLIPLAQCSRTLAGIVLPFLWAHVTVISPKDVESLLVAISRPGICSEAPNLGNLIYHLDVYTLWTYSEMDRILQRTPFLRTLHTTKPTTNLSSRRAVTWRTFPPLSHLTHVSLGYGLQERAYRLEEILDVGRRCLGLEHLWIAVVENDFTADSTSTRRPIVNFSSLRTLKLGSPLPGQMSNALRKGAFAKLLEVFSIRASLPRLCRLEVHEFMGDLSPFLRSLSCDLEVLVFQSASCDCSFLEANINHLTSVHTLVVRDVLASNFTRGFWPNLKRLYISSDLHIRNASGLAGRSKRVEPWLAQVALESYPSLRVIGFVAGLWTLENEENGLFKRYTEAGISVLVNRSGTYFRYDFTVTETEPGLSLEAMMAMYSS